MRYSILLCVGLFGCLAGDKSTDDATYQCAGIAEEACMGIVARCGSDPVIGGWSADIRNTWMEDVCGPAMLDSCLTAIGDDLDASVEAWDYACSYYFYDAGGDAPTCEEGMDTASYEVLTTIADLCPCITTGNYYYHATIGAYVCEDE